MATVQQAQSVWKCVVEESFLPVIRSHVDTIVRMAIENAKRTIEREMYDLVRDLEVRIQAMNSQFKAKGVTIDVVVHLPEEWEQRYGKDTKASKLPDPPVTGSN